MGGGGGGGGGHRGGHRGGGGGGRRGGGFWPGYGYGWGYPVQYAEPDVFIVQADTTDDEQTKRAMAYIMSLPKAQRAAAYVKIFGQPPPAGVLGDFDPGTAVTYAAVAVGGYLLYKLLKKR
jgi:hypothetical protein